MNRKLVFRVLMAVFVAGLFLTASCAKKTVVSDASTIEDQTKTASEEATEAEAEAARKAEQERIRQQELQEEAARKEAEVQARARFLNHHIHFAFDSAELTDTAKALLREKADWLKANPEKRIVIEGHCDERGTTEYNLALGERRAVAAKQYLEDLGISASRMTTVSYGEERPLDPAQNEAAYSMNRRAQFVLK
jgi:peptidoglycan-associated lipoprotein